MSHRSTVALPALLPLLALLAATACSAPDAPAADSDGAPGPEGAAGQADPAAPPVWAVDLVRTLPGRQAEYLRSIEANWAGARALVRERGAVLSYRALAAEPDSARGWDVILMTEYADSAAFADREEIFQAIFESPEFVPVETARPSSELREFFVGEVTLQEVASGG